MSHIYTDGACLLNYSGGLAIGLCGFYDENAQMVRTDANLTAPTTAYEMELKAIRMALEYIRADTIIYTDSMQAKDNLTTKNKRPKYRHEIKLRQFFEQKNKEYKIEIQWVKSHSDNAGNNLIDQKLEQEMARLIKQLPDVERCEVIDIVRERYERKGVFESFSKEFFVGLLSYK
jgi:ribonuclease HI